MWFARVGYANAPSTVFGLEYHVWKDTRELPAATASTAFTWAAISLQWFPVPRTFMKGLYVRGLFGLARLESQPANREFKGMGAGAGLGFEVPVWRGLALVPYVDLLGSEHLDFTQQTLNRTGRLETQKYWYRPLITTYGLSLRVSARQP